MNNKTLDYYNQNAKEFVAGTVAVDFNKIQDRFIEKLSGNKEAGISWTSVIKMSKIKMLEWKY